MSLIDINRESKKLPVALIEVSVRQFYALLVEMDLIDVIISQKGPFFNGVVDDLHNCYPPPT